MQDFAVVRFESPALGDATVQVRSLHGTERISQLFEFELHIVVANATGLDPAALMSSPASIVILRATTEDGQSREERRIFGMISHVTDRLTLAASHTEYLLTFVPRAWTATLTCLNDIFQEMTVPEIIEKKLKDNCSFEPSKDYELRLMASYPKREFVVQYQETDLAFISRLAEDQGICFFFEHVDGRDVMVFSDDNSGFRPADPESVPIASRGAELSVYDLVADHRQVTTTYRTRDYNYRNPSVDVLGEAQSPALGAGVIEEFGIHAKNAGEATTIARVRVEEEACHHHVYRGKGEVSGFRAGSVVKLEGHPRGDLELIVTEVHHHSTQAVLGSGGTGKENDYQNEFRAIPKKLTFRPPRVTPKPVVPGVITGVVQSASDKEMGAIDDQGRYRVSFMYDSVKTREEAKASRPLRMAQPSAGPDRGFHLPLKAGVEVLVTCVNGDPDRPIIAGAVPNPQTGSPVTAANSEKSGMRTNKSQWFIDDREPRFKLEVNGTEHVFQVGCPNGPELGFYLSTVSNATTVTKGMTTSIGAGLTAINKFKNHKVEKDIVEVAGKLDAFGWFEKTKAGLALATAALSTVQAGFEAVRKEHAAWLEDDQKQAERAVEQQQEALAGQIGVEDPVAQQSRLLTYPGDAKQVTTDNPDGTQTTRLETESEFRQRIIRENPSQGSADQRNALQTAQQNLANTTRAAADAKKAWEDRVWDISQGPVKEVTDAIAAVQEIIAAGESLHSTWGELFGKVEIAEEYTKLAARDLRTNIYCAASTERVKAPAKPLARPCNLKGAKGSVGITAKESVVAYGSNTVHVLSPRSVIATAGSSCHLKAKTVTEVAAGKIVKVTAGKLLDEYAQKTASIVAHASEQKMPGGHNFLVASEKHMKLISDTELHATGKKKLAVVSGTGAGAGIVADPKEICIGLVESGAAESKSKAKKDNAMSIKDKQVTIKAAESEWAIKKNGNIAAKAKGAVAIDCEKNMTLKPKGTFVADATKDATIKSGKKVKLNASGNCTIKGSKVMLG